LEIRVMNFRRQEANRDALEINPLAINKSQGRGAKVKAFLEKILKFEPTEESWGFDH